jgi:hypothetical protein
VQQRYAIDYRVLRWDALQSVWTRFVAGDTSTNDSYVAWGQDVVVAKSGRVIACWRNALDNLAPGDTSVFQAGNMPGGGNMFYVQHDDGTVALYAHLQAGTVSALCPNDCTTYTSNEASPDYYWQPGSTTCSHWLHESVNAPVVKGALLGQIGNSGSSSAPHLHFHLMQANADHPSTWPGLPVYFTEVATDQEVPPAQPTEVPLLGQAGPAPWISDEYSLLWKLLGP